MGVCTPAPIFLSIYRALSHAISRDVFLRSCDLLNPLVYQRYSLYMLLDFIWLSFQQHKNEEPMQKKKKIRKLSILVQIMLSVEGETGIIISDFAVCQVSGGVKR